MSFIRSTALAGAFTVAVSFAATAAQIINAQIVGIPTAGNMPFTLENFGSGGPTNADGRVSTAAFTSSTA